MSTFMDAFRGSRHQEYGDAGAAAAPASAPAEMIEGYAVRDDVRGQDGMLSGAGYNPLAVNQASRPVENPANAEAMTHYVSAESVYNALPTQSRASGQRVDAPAVTGAAQTLTEGEGKR